MTTTAKKSTGKNLKAQLFAAIAMMLVASVALGTSTYAWFVNNAAPKVDTMQFTATTAEGLEIAVNKPDSTFGEAGAFRGTITNDNITAMGIVSGMDYTTNFFKGKMVPASITTENLKKSATSLTTLPTDFFISDELNTIANEYNTYAALAASDLVNGVKTVPLYFKASEDMSVYLKAAKDATATGLITPKIVAGGAQYDADNVTTAEKAILVSTINATSSDGTYTISTTGATALNALYATEVAAIQKSIRIGFAGVTGLNNDVIIYEPDQTILTDHSKNTTNWNGNMSGTTVGSLNTIAAINDDLGGAGTITTKGYIKSVGVQTTLTEADQMFKYCIPKTGNSVADSGEATGKTLLFSLKANVVKQINVFVWLEGTDNDCVAAIAANHFAVNLNFVGGSASVVAVP